MRTGRVFILIGRIIKKDKTRNVLRFNRYKNDKLCYKYDLVILQKNVIGKDATLTRELALLRLYSKVATMQAVFSKCLLGLSCIL